MNYSFENNTFLFFFLFFPSLLSTVSKIDDDNEDTRRLNFEKISLFVTKSKISRRMNGREIAQVFLTEVSRLRWKLDVNERSSNLSLSRYKTISQNEFLFPVKFDG